VTMLDKRVELPVAWIYGFIIEPASDERGRQADGVPDVVAN
jgi:hypothetical protein